MNIFTAPISEAVLYDLVNLDFYMFCERNFSN